MLNSIKQNIGSHLAVAGVGIVATAGISLGAMNLQAQQLTQPSFAIPAIIATGTPQDLIPVVISLRSLLTTPNLSSTSEHLTTSKNSARRLSLRGVSSSASMAKPPLGSHSNPVSRRVSVGLETLSLSWTRWHTFRMLVKVQRRTSTMLWCPLPLPFRPKIPLLGDPYMGMIRTQKLGSS